jgi:microcystin-dependent protein
MSEVLNLTGLGNMNVNPSNVPYGDCLVTKQYVDNYVSSNSFFVGQIKMYCGKTLPSGWLFCNGQSLSKTTYKSLFDVIGTNYGQDPTITNNFLLPNLTSSIPICSQQLDSINIQYQGNSKYSGGNIKISSEQLTSHSHTIPEHNHDVTFSINTYNAETRAGAKGARLNVTAIVGFTVNTSNTVKTNTDNPNNSSGNTGNGNDFLPPFCVINFIIYYGS